MFVTFTVNIEVIFHVWYTSIQSCHQICHFLQVFEHLFVMIVVPRCEHCSEVDEGGVAPHCVIEKSIVMIQIFFMKIVNYQE